MRRIAIFVCMSVCMCGALFAQDARVATEPPALSTFAGTLALSEGRFVLKDGDTVYYTRGIERFVGYIDGLKDGAEVSIDGYVFESSRGRNNSNEKFLRAVKLTLDGKTYEVGPTLTQQGGFPRRGPGGFGSGAPGGFGDPNGPGGFGRCGQRMW